MRPKKEQSLTTVEDVIENHEQAQALADSLWDEMERYRDNIIQIEIKLRALKEKWSVVPRMRVVDVRPKPKAKTEVKQGLTTGEVSKMLGIRRGEILKFFVQGILTGWRNPVTGRVTIDLESVEALAKKSGIEVPSERQLEENLKAKTLKRRWAVIPVTHNDVQKED